MRITNSMMVSSLMYNLQRNLGRLDKTNQELATGKKYSIPQENPLDAVLSMKFRTKINESQQFSRNIDDGLQMLEVSDSTLDNGIELLRRARQLAIQGANDTLTQSDRDALAQEVNEILNAVVAVANTDFKGNYIFAGFNNDNPPFEVFKGGDAGQSADILSSDWRGGIYPDRPNINLENITEVRYAGNEGISLRHTQSAVDMAVNSTGSETFLSSVHRIEAGASIISDPFLPLNHNENFDGTLNPLAAEGAFSVGIEGGQMTAVAYDGNRHSLSDIADQINRNARGVMASIEKHENDGVAEYRLILESREPGRRIVLEDSVGATLMRSRRDLALDNPDFDESDGGGWLGLFGGGAGPADDDQIIVNGVQFVLGDYSDIDDLMNAVEKHPDARIEGFRFNSTDNVFSITSSRGESLSMQHAGTNGFFSAGFMNIDEPGNLMERLGMLNKAFSASGLPQNTPLKEYGIQDGQLEINGHLIEIDARRDTLDMIAVKINSAETGIRASLQEYPVNAGLPADERTYRLVLESEHPGPMNIYDRDTGFFCELGIQDKSTLEIPGYGQHQSPYSNGVFDVLMNVRDHLYNSDTDKLSGMDLRDMDRAIDSLLQIRTRTGARINALEATQKKIGDIEYNTSMLLSKVEDVDIAETIMKLNMQESVYRSALASGSRVIQPTLMDYIR